MTHTAFLSHFILVGFLSGLCNDLDLSDIAQMISMWLYVCAATRSLLGLEDSVQQLFGDASKDNSDWCLRESLLFVVPLLDLSVVLQEPILGVDTPRRLISFNVTV